MASSKGKARDPPEKKRVTQPISNIRVKAIQRKRTKRSQQPYDSVSVPQLVYELLNIDKYNQDSKRESPERYRTTHRRMQRYCEQQRFPYEAVDSRDSSESIQIPKYKIESRPTSTESLTEVMDVAHNSAHSSSSNSSMLNVSDGPITLVNSLNNAKALFKKKSLVQLINSYIKAGIEEGKRQAKKYICKALSFGVRSGYLIPTDRRGNVFRVCPTLTISERTDVESRKRRHIARRGETRVMTINDRRLMRRGIPWRKSRTDIPMTTSKKRYRQRSLQNPVRSLNSSDSGSRGSFDESSLRERKKPKSRLTKKKSVNSSNIKKQTEGTVKRKRQQQWKRDNTEDIRKSVKRRRRTSSPKDMENNRKSIERNCRNANSRDRERYKRNEDDYRADIEKQKSTPNGEKASKLARARTNINDDQDLLHNNTNEKSEEENSEHDVNDITKETDT